MNRICRVSYEGIGRLFGFVVCLKAYVGFESGQGGRLAWEGALERLSFPISYSHSTNVRTIIDKFTNIR